MKQAPVNSSVRDRILFSDPDLEKYCALAIQGGVTNAKQIHPGTIVTAPWVRLKCQFGCAGYGKGHCCPPRTPGPQETREILDSYRRAILFHIEDPAIPEEPRPFLSARDALIDLEGEMFKDGYYKAFIFLSGPCRLCRKCEALEDKTCQFPLKARPCMESCGMDVYETVRNNGFFIKPLREKTEPKNYYCLMMVD